MRREITLAEAGDILTTAFEGGIGYWAMADEIERDSNLTVLSLKLYDTEHVNRDLTFNGEPNFPPTVVTVQAIKETWTKIADAVSAGNPPFCSDYLEQMHENTLEPGDAGCVDAGVADCIVQIAALGEVVYG